MNSVLFYAICGLLMLLIIYKQRKCYHLIWQLNGWCGLLQQPMLWLILILYMEPNSIMSCIQRFHKYFRFPLAIIVFNRILLYVDDPDSMESILTAPECINKTFMQNGFHANKGLLHAKDEQWKIRRKQLNPAFSYKSLVSFFGVFNRVANELKLKISKDLPDCKIEFKTLEDLITRAILQVSCLTTMGCETNFLKNDEKCIAQAYRYLTEVTALKVLRPWYQIDFIFRLLDNENYEKSKRVNKLVTEFMANIVHQKHIEWQQKNRLHQKPDIKNTTSDCVTATNRGKAEMPSNENRDNHNFPGNMEADGNDALNSTVQQILSLPDKNKDSSAFMPKQQQQLIFIDQLFNLAQLGKLTLQEIMNESESMVVVSFETVSNCIMNALLCLAINHECQMKLRYEIQQVLLSKIKSKSKTKPTTTTSSVTQNNDSTRKTTATNSKSTCANKIDNDIDLDTTANVHYKGDAKNSLGSEYDDDDDGDGDDVEVTMEDLLNMPYLDMVISESLRLLATVPITLRNVSADFQLNVIERDKCTCNTKNPTPKNTDNNKNSCSSCQRCVVVPKDTIVALDVFNMQRNEMYWGDNALKFYPEHFSKGISRQQQQIEKDEVEHETSISSTTAQLTSRHSFAFIPFLKGLRTCIGYRYSVYLSKIVLIKLILSFELSTNIQLQDMQFYEGVSLKFRNADKIQFQIHPVG